MRGALEAAGYEAAASRADAGLVVLNTCTVTADADADARQAIYRARRENPNARIVVAGCFAQRAPEEAARLEGVTWVVGNTHKHMLAEIVQSETERILVGDISAERTFAGVPAAPVSDGRTRPNLKVQDGCDCRCSFCVVPRVRGPSRSAPPEEVVRAVRNLVPRYSEIVLSGVNLGRWGRELRPPMRLADLLRRLLAETGVARLRLSSVEPLDLKDDLLELMASTPRIAQHIHAPLQSGSDAVLRRMRRWYRARHYAGRILKVRAAMPDAAIGADVLVGFPGETEAEFDGTRALIERLPLTYLHVFTYSARPGTAAASMDGQVAVRERKRRNRILREIAAAKNLAFRQTMAGKRLAALPIADGTTALTGNYLKVELAAPRPANRIVEVEIAGVTSDGLRERLALPADAVPGVLQNHASRSQ